MARLAAVVTVVLAAELLPAEGQPEVAVSRYTSGVSVHDPSIIRTQEGYYIFGSHMEVARTADLRRWTRVATGVNGANRLFDNLFTDRAAFEYVGRNDQGWYSVWAPDVIYNRAMGKYVMYFCTTSTYVKSNLCMATADAVEGPYTYQGIILYSGFTRLDMDKTDVLTVVNEEDAGRYLRGSRYENNLWPNAIDPNVFYDAEGRMWMAYGSWSGGIFVLEIDESTGLPIHPQADEANRVDPYFGKHLLGGSHQSIEGVYVVYDAESRYYFLFVSYGGLTSNGGYQLRAFRSRRPDGPYVDPAGQTLGVVFDHGKYGLKLLGNYTLPSLSLAYMSPGHGSALIREDGTRLLVYHVRFDDGGERHEPRVHQWFLNEEEWPVVAPEIFGGEELPASGYGGQVAGEYHLVGFGTDISAGIHEPSIVRLGPLGAVVDDDGRSIGRWSRQDGTPFMSISLAGVEFRGVFVRQVDEAGNNVMAFTAASRERASGDASVGTNESVWGLRYLGRK
jgi:arabinan endo-1,5-alpha-L-arabinosidase